MPIAQVENNFVKKIKTIAQIDEFHIDEQTINKLGLQLSEKVINAQIAPSARVFEYPHLDKVFIMENDLYGNVMP